MWCVVVCVCGRCAVLRSLCLGPHHSLFGALPLSGCGGTCMFVLCGCVGVCGCAGVFWGVCDLFLGPRSSWLRALALSWCGVLCVCGVWLRVCVCAAGCRGACSMFLRPRQS